MMHYYAILPDSLTINWSDYPQVRVAIRKPLTGCAPQATNDDGDVYPNCWSIEYDGENGADPELLAIIPEGFADLTNTEHNDLIARIKDPQSFTTDAVS